MASKSPMTTAGVMRLIAREMGRAAIECPAKGTSESWPGENLDPQEVYMDAHAKAKAILDQRFGTEVVTPGHYAMELVRDEAFRTQFLRLMAAEAAIVADQFRHLGLECFPSQLRAMAETEAADEVEDAAMSSAEAEAERIYEAAQDKRVPTAHSGCDDYDDAAAQRAERRAYSDRP